MKTGGEGSGWRDWLRAARDVWFPPVCAHCRGLVGTPGRRFLCPRCAARVHRVDGPHCTTCGSPFAGAGAVDRACPHCHELDPVFREGRTAVLLRGPARSLVIGLKYHGATHLLEEIGLLIREAPGFADYLRGAILVPVPLHPRKERERGYNQSELLAQTFAAAAGAGTRVERLLVRVVDTRTQTRLDRKTRRENLKNAFATDTRRPINPAHRFVLVDDVFTTGATLNACAAALRSAHCLNVDVATFGHG